MRKRAATLGLISGILLLVMVVVLVRTAISPWVPYVSRSRIPPPVVVRMPATGSAVRIFPGAAGVFFVLPDGSLWRWGQTVGVSPTRAAVPQQVGTDHDWLQAFAANSQCVALRTDGSFWSWGYNFATARTVYSTPPPITTNPPPDRVGTDHDWVSVAAGDIHSVALKRDGTVWAWGFSSDGQLGNGPAETNQVRLLGLRVDPIQTNLVQVGTNRDWRAISASGLHTLGLRADGTLWIWGRVHLFSKGKPGTVFPVPTQVCSETNWVELLGDCVLNRRGELWLALYAPPNLLAPASMTCQLLCSNCVPGRFAIAHRFYQLHPDGTLWESRIDPRTWGPEKRWDQVGKRSDWRSICGFGTVLGVTADGTVWMWGSDLGQEGVMPPGVRFKQAANRITSLLGVGSSNPGTAYWVTPLQPEPRPLLRIISTGPASAAASSSSR
jgi:hypothetical protein